MLIKSDTKHLTVRKYIVTYSLGGTELVEVHIVHVTVLPDKVRLERFDKLNGDVERNRNNVLEDDQTRTIVMVEEK